MSGKQIKIEIKSRVGDFAENKDKARDIRIKDIEPALKQSKKIVINFSGVTGATQSFIHALLSQLIRDYGPEVLEQIDFKNCNPEVQGVITIVVDYMQQVD